MIAHQVEADFAAQIRDGVSFASAVKSVEEAAKSKQRYKRFGPVRTHLYEFWDKSVFMVGRASDGWILFKACADRVEMDGVVLTGVIDDD